MKNKVIKINENEFHIEIKRKDGDVYYCIVDKQGFEKLELTDLICSYKDSKGYLHFRCYYNNRLLKLSNYLLDNKIKGIYHNGNLFDFTYKNITPKKASLKNKIIKISDKEFHIEIVRKDGIILYCIVDDVGLKKIKDSIKVLYALFVSKKYYYARFNADNDNKMFLHRFLMDNPKGLEIDHINGNTLDNRYVNLRTCTKIENGRNRIYKKEGESKYTGVRLDKRDNTWSAAIKINYKSIYLGQYKNEHDAAEAYNEAVIKYFGEFGRLNRIIRD
jgi:hypothetical protein